MECAGGVRIRGRTPCRWVSDSELGGLRLGGDCTLVWEGTWGCAAQFMGGRASDHPVLSLLPPAFAASNPNERTTTAHSRCIQNSLHEPHAHPTPNTNTKLKYHPHVLNPDSNGGSALKALFPPHPPGTVHIVLAHLPLPPLLCMSTWTRWYAAVCSYTAWLGRVLMSGERVSWVRIREGEFGLSVVPRLTLCGYGEFTLSLLLFLSFFS